MVTVTSFDIALCQQLHYKINYHCYILLVNVFFCFLYVCLKLLTSRIDKKQEIEYIYNLAPVYHETEILLMVFLIKSMF